MYHLKSIENLEKFYFGRVCFQSNFGYNYGSVFSKKKELIYSLENPEFNIFLNSLYLKVQFLWSKIIDLS